MPPDSQRATHIFLRHALGVTFDPFEDDDWDEDYPPEYYEGEYDPYQD